MREGQGERDRESHTDLGSIAFDLLSLVCLDTFSLMLDFIWCLVCVYNWFALVLNLPLVLDLL